MNCLKITDNCYIIRYVAGQYWLLDISQPGIPYKKPLIMNEVGAKIWEALLKNYSLDQMSHELSAEYEVEKEIIEADVLEFLEQLKVYGVKIEEV